LVSVKLREVIMSSLLIRCPVTTQVAELGIEVDSATFLRMPLDTPLACPLCGQMHSWENAIPPPEVVALVGQNPRAA
jgi:hypothetical protein